MIGTGYIYNLERLHDSSLKTSFLGSMVAIRVVPRSKDVGVSRRETVRSGGVGSQEWERIP
jgi:hypothetical protein